MTTKHTPGPWYFNDEDEGITTEERKCKRQTRIATVTLGWAEPFNSEQLENARRIVACVNACEGISTEKLEENKPIIEFARAYNTSLIELARAYDVSLRKRDDLLEALQEMVRTFGKNHAPAVDVARTAIARATGEHP